MNHSFHFFHNSVTFDKLNNNILDKNGVLVLKICNLCNVPGLYNPVLEKTMIKKKSLINYKKFFGFRDINSKTVSNYKIKVNINFNEISKLIKSGREIPQRESLFKLLRRNINSKLKNDELINTIVDTNTNTNTNTDGIKSNKLITYYSDSIVNCEGLYFDIELERIYLSNSDILRNKYNTISKESLYFYQSRDKLDKFFENNNNFILLTENPNKYKFLEKSINNIHFLDSNKNYTFNELNNQNIVMDFSKLLESEENTENFVECRKYEYSFLKESEKSKKIVIPQLLNYSNVILDDSIYYSNKIGKTQIIKSFIGSSNIVILSRFFYKYRISDIKNWYNTILDKDIVISRDFVSKIVALSSSEIIKLNSKESNIKTIILESFELEYFNKNFNKYSFNIEEFTSLPYNFIKDKYRHITFLPEETCGICFDELTNKNIAVTSSCNHYFCINCLEKVIKIKSQCPLCRTTTDACKGIFEDLNKYYGKKIKFINQYINKNKNTNIVLVSKFKRTRNTLENIFSKKKIISVKDYSYVENCIESCTLFFMETLTDEYKYINYLISNNKSFFFNLKLKA